MGVTGNSIGLDVDGVLCNFAQGFIDQAYEDGYGEHVPKHWTHVNHWDICPMFSTIMRKHWTSEKFWLDLKPLVSNELHFTPRCYITSRAVKSDVTAEWLETHGFPKAPVVTVSKPEHKYAYIRMFGLDLFVDDLYTTVKQVLDLGGNAVLYKAPYQRGHYEECRDLPIISDLREIVCTN